MLDRGSLQLENIFFFIQSPPLVVSFDQWWARSYSVLIAETVMKLPINYTLGLHTHRALFLKIHFYFIISLYSLTLLHLKWYDFFFIININMKIIHLFIYPNFFRDRPQTPYRLGPQQMKIWSRAENVLIKHYYGAFCISCSFHYYKLECLCASIYRIYNFEVAF